MRRPLALAALAATTLALAACGLGQGGSGYAPADPYGALPVAPAADPSAAPTSAPASTEPAIALLASDAPELGTIVTDADGFTLYRFDEDTAEPPATTCVDACAVKWPPFVVDPKGTLTLDGVEQSAIGLVERPDGTTQLTVGGWPVYRFADDGAAGAIEGQGVGDTWFAVAPDGAKVQ